MPGMYFELFVLMTIVILVLFLAAIGWRKFWPLILVGIFLILTGAALLSDGMVVEVGSSYDRDTGVTTYDYNALTPANDTTIAIFANSYFYGGFIAIVMGLGMLVWGRVAGVED